MVFAELAGLIIAVLIGTVLVHLSVSFLELKRLL
jgi:hypothetical protein